MQAERDDRLSLPSAIPELFMRCFGDKFCNETNILVETLDPNALEAGAASVFAFGLLPDPADDPASVALIVQNLKALFGKTGFNATAQRARVWSWVQNWDDLAESGAALDALVPWFENMPTPQQDDPNVGQFLQYLYYSDAAPAFRATLRANLQTWLDAEGASDDPQLAYIMSQGGAALIGE